MNKRVLLTFVLNVAALWLLAQSSGTLNGHEFVDLGLTVKWATCNVGAYSPEKSGTYYAWGETSPKYDYSWHNYFDAKDNEGENFYEYFTSTMNRRGRNKIEPQSGRDVARKEWGATWRLPTREEMDELTKKCRWNWGNINGQNGFWVVGPNGNSIFLPATGCIEGTTRHIYNRHGLYQTSTLYFQQYEYALYFIQESVSIGNMNRCAGVPIRPVTN